MDLVYSDENILCCATAGSGKTTTLAEKVKQILRSHPDPYIILATFSRDAANEMALRIKNSKITPPVDPAMLRRVSYGTFHSLALSQLKQAGKVLKILSSLEIRHAIQRSLWDMGIKMPTDKATELIASCKSNPVFADENPEMADLTEIYQGYLESMQGMDFTDILLQANRLMATGQQGPLRATHLLADEYQDTDSVQADWLEHHMMPGRIACAVGDDDQSIYAFRRSLGYRGMTRFIAATEARIIRLDTNYRSTAGIVFSAGHLIEKNGDRIQKDFKVARGDGPLPTVVAVSPTGDDQATMVVSQIIALCRNNPMTEEERKTFEISVGEGEVAIIARTNIQLDAMEEACRRMGVPFNRNGSLFWDMKVLQVFLILLQSLDQREGSAIEIGLRWAGIADKALSKMTELGGGLWSLASPIGKPIHPSFPRHALSLLTIFRGFTPFRDGNRDAGAKAAIDEMASWMRGVLAGESAFPDTRGSGSPAKSKGITPSAQFAMKVLEIGRTSLRKFEGSLKSRINKVQSNTSRKDKAGVALTTMHSSKGLEWRSVFLTDIDGGSMPPPDAEVSVDAMEEERRIFFVAMTRARDHLTLFRSSDKPVSQFLIDANLHTNGAAKRL